MTKHEESLNAQMTKDARVNCFVIRIFVIPSSLDIRHSSFGTEVKREPIASQLGHVL
jgi:hypothetical protein